MSVHPRCRSARAVVVLSGAAPLEQVAPHFLRWTAHERVRRPRPWLVAKWAQTLDGRIATRTGESRWISNAASRTLVHRRRGQVDAVLTGIGGAATTPDITEEMGANAYGSSAADGVGKCKMLLGKL